MRYSIFEFSQEKLLEYELDVIDALILNWFTQFYSGKMEKLLVKDIDGTECFFGWVKISKIMEDIPVIGIATEKGVRNRFDKYVEKGILERQTISTQSGKRSYYKTTDIYDSLVNTIAKTKKQASEKQEFDSTEKTDEGIVSTDDDSVISEVVEDAIISQGNSSSFAKTEISQSPQTTLAKKNYYTNSSQSPQTTFANIKSDEKISQRNSTSFAERNCTTYAQGNSTSFALNDSHTNDSITKNSQTNGSIKFINATAAIDNAILNFFGKDAFDSQFINKASNLFNQYQFNNDDINGFFRFIKAKTDKRQPVNPRGFAYSIFFKNDVMGEFLDMKQQQLLFKNNNTQNKAETKERHKLICPVCKMDFYQTFEKSCPYCDFEVEKFGDEKAINRQKKICMLPGKVRNEYENAIMSFKSEMPINQRLLYIATPEGKTERDNYYALIDKKYGIEA